jgi:hypothetical protein
MTQPTQDPWGNTPQVPNQQPAQPYIFPQPGYGPQPQPPVYPQQQQPPPVYYQQAGYPQQPQQQPGLWNPSGVYGGIVEKPQGKPLLYLLPGGGALLLLLSTFLPWLIIRIMAAEFSVNGLGVLTAPPGFLESMSKLAGTTGAATSSNSNSSPSYGLADGWLLLVLSVLALILVLGGLFQKTKVYSIGVLILGIVSLGVVGIDFINVNATISNFNTTVSQNAFASAMGSIQMGFGLYLGIIAAFLMPFGSVLTFFLFNSNQATDVYGNPKSGKSILPAWGWVLIGLLILSVASFGIFVTISSNNNAAQTVSVANSVPTVATNNASTQINATATAYAEKVYANLTAGAVGAVPQSNSGQSSIPTAIPTIRSIPTPTLAPQAIKGKTGDTLSQNGYIVTVNQAEKSTSYGDYDKAKDGFIFVAVDVTIQSDKASGVSVNGFYCSLKDGQGFKYSQSFSSKQPSLKSQNDLPKGEKIRGWVTFEVPKTAQGFTFEYNPLDFLNTTSISFVLE